MSPDRQICGTSDRVRGDQLGCLTSTAGVRLSCERRRIRRNTIDKGTRGEARLHVDVPPERLYDVVTDVRRMGEWSPECVACEWLEGATGPAVGARFRGRNKHGFARWSTKPEVVTAAPGREFAFVIRHLGRDMTKWTYRFEPADDGTDLTESFEMLSDLPVYFRLTDRLFMGVKDRKADLETNMRQTLERIKAAAEERGGGEA